MTHPIRHILRPAVLLLVGLPAGAAELQRGGPEDLAEFRATVDRFSDRMEEFQAEAKAEVDRREAEERRALNRSYDAILSEFGEDDLALRATAIRRFEEFLGEYPRAPHAAHVMFRLAELYYEESEEAYLAADLRFQDALDAMDQGDLDTIPEEPQRDYSRSIELYRKIVQTHPDYREIAGCYYMLAFTLGSSTAVQYDEAESQAMYRVIVDQYPDSVVAANAHLRIGEYLFDYNQLEEAIPHYEAVVRLEGQDGSLYDDGLYKLAWTNYRLSRYEVAIDQLNQLMDWSVDVFQARSGKESSMAPEAIQYAAISFADLASIEGQSALEMARQFYADRGGRSYEAKVYKSLAKVLEQQARWDEAIATYSYLQETWPSDPDNPTYQWQIALLHNTKAPPDREASQAAIAQLDARFREGSGWYADNRNNPDALSTARSYIERSLASVANSYHIAAEDSQRPEDFRTAADTYKRYLKQFPFADDYYETQWYYATTLLKAGDPAGAEVEYERLHESGKHVFHEAALWPLRALRFQRLVDVYGGHEQVPPDATVEREVDLGEGNTRKVYALSEAHQSFVESADALVSADFGPAIAALDRREAEVAAISDKDERTAAKQSLDNERQIVEGIAAAMESSRSGIMYQVAQTLYAHNRFDEARPRLEAVIAQYPESMNAAYAARLDADSYLDEDLGTYRQKVAYYAANPPGPPKADGSVDASEFKDLVQRADFQLAEKLAKAKDYAGAAGAYVAFYNNYPSSEFRPLALRNAANNYERSGNLEQSINLLETYVQEYPDDEYSRDFYFRLAGVYAQALELDRAINYYQTLYDKTRGSGIAYVDASSALYNAGFLRVGLRDFQGAARNFELYGKAFPDEGDSEQIAFMAGEQYERVGNQEAIAFYRRYLADYGDQNPDHVMEALHAIAEITEETSSPSAADDAWNAVSEAYARLAPEGKVGAAGRHYAAHAAYRRLEQQFEQFQQISFTKDDTANAKLLVITKQEELNQLRAAGDGLVRMYQDFEYGTGALMLTGKAFFAYADMLYNQPIPAVIAADDDLMFAFQERVDELRLPVEDKGKARMAAVLDQAKAKKRWTQFQTETVAFLAKRFPGEFAEEKEQFRGDGESSYVPLADPVGARPKAPPPPPPSPTPSPASSSGGAQ